MVVISIASLIAACVPISRAPSQRNVAENEFFDLTNGGVVPFSNRNLGDYNLDLYLGSKSKTGYNNRDENIISFSPAHPDRYSYVLDTLIIRWAVLDSSTKYSFEISDIVDQRLAIIQADGLAFQLSMPALESLSVNRSMLIVQFKRLSNKRSYQNRRMILLSPEKSETRRLILRELGTMDSTIEKVEFLMTHGYPLDALSMIEQDIRERKDSVLVDRYWAITNKLLQDLPPNLER